MHASPLPALFSSSVDLEASLKDRGFYSWEMESVSESSQQQKRKLVTHGLEDQKRVSGRTFFCHVACGAGIAKLESKWPSQCCCVEDACASFSGEGGRWWLVICQVRVLGVKP